MRIYFYWHAKILQVRKWKIFYFATMAFVLFAIISSKLLTGGNASEEHLRMAFFMIQYESAILSVLFFATDFFVYFHLRGRESSFVYRKRLLIGWNLFSFAWYVIFCLPMRLIIQQANNEYANSIGIFLLEMIEIRLLMSVVIVIGHSVETALAVGICVICFCFLFGKVMPAFLSILCAEIPIFLSDQWYIGHALKSCSLAMIVYIGCR